MWMWPFSNAISYFCPRCDRAVRIKPGMRFSCPRGKVAGFEPCFVMENYYTLTVGKEP